MSFEIIEGGMSQTADFAKETSDNSFDTDVLMASVNSPVIVVFYSAFNVSCVKFVDMATEVAKLSSDRVTLIKANIDKCPAVMQAMQIQNIPTVYVFFQGQAIDGFAGMMPEAEVRSFIDKISNLGVTSKEEEKQGLSIEEVTKIMSEADELMSDEEYDLALDKYSMLLEDDEKNMDALAGIGWCLASQGDMDSVREMLSNLTSEQKSGVSRISSLEFIANIQPIDSIEKLSAKDGLDSVFELSKAYIAVGDFDSAFDSLIKIISQNREWKGGKAHKFLLEFFESLGNNHPATRRGKRKLSVVLFS